MFARNPEQVRFYKSRKWEAVRTAYLEAKHYTCERCGRPAIIVHHKQYIDAGNVGDPSVTLSFSNLECLCQTCHNAEHFGTGATAPGTRFDENGELVAALTTE